jgi:hypothetical protein
MTFHHSVWRLAYSITSHHVSAFSVASYFRIYHLDDVASDRLIQPMVFCTFIGVGGITYCFTIMT